MASNSFHQQIATMKQTLLDEGIINEQFTVFESLITYEEPDVGDHVINGYANETKAKLAQIEENMDKTPIDYSTLEKTLHDLEIFFEFMGAKTMKIEVNKTKECCQQGNMKGAKAALEGLKRENETFKAKMASYFQLVKQAKEFVQDVNDPK